MTQELQEYGRPAAAARSGKATPSPAVNGGGGDGGVEEIVRLSSKPLDNADIPCAFWDALPEPGSDHPDLLAIEALKAESSVLERAETLKVRRISYFDAIGNQPSLFFPEENSSTFLSFLNSSRSHTLPPPPSRPKQ